MSDRMKCPYCGATVRLVRGMVPPHEEDTGRRLWTDRRDEWCPGSQQNPRSEYDRRPTWRDEDANKRGGSR